MRPLDDKWVFASHQCIVGTKAVVQDATCAVKASHTVCQLKAYVQHVRQRQLET